MILASGSPRRKELLKLAGIDFKISAPELSEEIHPGESPRSIVSRLSREKAIAVGKGNSHEIVLAADTIVAIDDYEPAEILCKPTNQEDAQSMLLTLQGRKHAVYTGFCLYRGTPPLEVVRVVRSEVWFRSLSKSQIKAYVETGEPLDKAGAYALQGKGACFVERVNGSFTNVIGLPLCEVLEELEKIKAWDFSTLKRD